MPESLEVYAFLDRRERGTFPVFDTAGRDVARIRQSVWTRRFEAHTPGGALLCAGRAVPFTRAVDVHDGAGRLFVKVYSRFWQGRQRVVELADGPTLTLQAERWPGRDWAATDESGRVALSIVATASGWAFHPDAYAVQVGDPSLTLAHVVAVVHANRMLVKAARSAAAS